MKCPNCGFDKILPMYKVCPKCKQPLNTNSVEPAKAAEQPQTEENTKLLTGLFWSYQKAVKDPAKFKEYAKRNPHDSARLWMKWVDEGRDMSPLADCNPVAEYAKPETVAKPQAAAEQKPASSAKPQPTSGKTKKDEDAEADAAVHAEVVASAHTAAQVADKPSVVADTDVIAVGSRNRSFNYVTWNIAPGQIARKISAQAFQELDKVDGVLVQEGVTAVVFVDGILTAELQGGLYKFANERIRKEALQKTEEDIEDKRAEEGLFRKIGRAGRSLWNLLTGQREAQQRAEGRKKRERVQELTRRLSADSVVEVILKRDSTIQLMMGIRPNGKEGDEAKMEFAPYKIRTKTLTLDVAVSLEVGITDFKLFRTTYLMDRMSYSVNDVRTALNTWMRTSIQRQLQDYEADGLLLTEEKMVAISYDIMSQSRQYLHGIEVLQVLDITTDNAAFDRFRELDEKLFVTDKEIDYLTRTNDFKNRLQNVENAQRLSEARTELDLRKELDAINNDKLVHEDEMEAFVQLLQSQKRIREAKNENEELAALLELKGNRLLTEDDFDALENSIRDKKFDRAQVSAAFQLTSENRTDNVRLQMETQLEKSRILAAAELKDARFEALRKEREQEYSIDDMAAAHRRDQEHVESAYRRDEGRAESAYRREEERAESAHQSEILDDKLSAAERTAAYEDKRRETDYDFDKRKREDHYQESRREAQDVIDLEKQRTQNQLDAEKQHAQTEMDILRQKAELARQNMQAMQQHEQEMAEKKHQEEMARIAAQQSMSADQLMAAGMAGMDAEAQRAFAESFAASKSAQEKEALLREMMAMQNQHSAENNANAAAQMQQMQQMMSQMMQFSQDAMQTNAQMASNMAAGQAGQQQAHLDAIQNVAGARLSQTEAIKEEYHKQMEHEQKRTDAAQDKALNYTTKVTQEEIKASAKVGKTSSVEPKNPYYLPDFGASYSLKEVGNMILNGQIDPDTEIEVDGTTLSVAEVDDLFPFLKKKFGNA